MNNKVGHGMPCPYIKIDSGAKTSVSCRSAVEMLQKLAIVRKMRSQSHSIVGCQKATNTFCAGIKIKKNKHHPEVVGRRLSFQQGAQPASFGSAGRAPC